MEDCPKMKTGITIGRLSDLLSDLHTSEVDLPGGWVVKLMGFQSRSLEEGPGMATVKRKEAEGMGYVIPWQLGVALSQHFNSEANQ
jgi:hypothetical protein